MSKILIEGVTEHNPRKIRQGIAAGVVLPAQKAVPGIPKGNPAIRSLFTIFSPNYEVDEKDALQGAAIAMLKGIIAEDEIRTAWMNAVSTELMYCAVNQKLVARFLDRAEDPTLMMLEGAIHLRSLGEAGRLSSGLYLPYTAIRVFRIESLRETFLEVVRLSDLRMFAGDSERQLAEYREFCRELLKLSYSRSEAGDLAFACLDSGKDPIPVEAAAEHFEREELTPEERLGASIRLAIMGRHVPRADLPPPLLELIQREAKSQDLVRELAALQVAAYFYPDQNALIAQARERGRQFGAWSVEQILAEYGRRGLTLETAPAEAQMQLILTYGALRVTAVDILTHLADDSAEARAIAIQLLSQPEAPLWGCAYDLAKALRIPPQQLAVPISTGVQNVGRILTAAPTDVSILTAFLPSARSYFIELLGETPGLVPYRQLTDAIRNLWGATIEE